MKTWRFVSFSLCLSLASLTSTAQSATNYPERPITVIVPYAAGGTGDLLMRKMSPSLSEHLGQPIIIENKPGASGKIGVQHVLRSEPNGYKYLLTATNNLVIDQLIDTKLGYDPLSDLALVTMVVEVPNVIYVSPSLPVESWDEFIEYVKSKPGEINFGSPGIGTAPHLAAERLAQQMSLDMHHIAYTGSSPVVHALMNGEVHLLLGGATLGAHFVETNHLKALAVASPERLAALPNTPTFTELGIDDISASNWWALAAPMHTNPNHIKAFSDAVTSVINSAEMKSFLDSQGEIAAADGSEALTQRTNKEITEWKKVVDNLDDKIKR